MHWTRWGRWAKAVWTENSKGLEALDMVRIEVDRFSLDHNPTTQTDPFEAYIGFTAPLKSV